MSSHRALRDGEVCALAAAVFAGARAGLPVPVVPAVAAVAVALAWRRPVLLVVAAVALASSLSARSTSGLRLAATGPWSGWAAVLSDPVRDGGAVRAELRVAGKHVRAVAHGRAAVALERRQAGERVRVDATLRPLVGAPPAWMRARHLAGRATVRAVDGWRPAPLPYRVANAVRGVLRRGAASMPVTPRSLFAGFVLGDGREQPDGVADDFRAAGLSHLLVVSGQNVAFVLSLAGPLLVRLRRRARFVAGACTLLLFGTVVRWEPSVLRACAMAALVLYAALLGRPVSSLRVLGLAVAALLLVDPQLAWSLGFGLSVGACVGIALLATRLGSALPGPRWLAVPLATTIAAQAGTAPLLAAGLGGVPLVAPVANLLALPAAEPITVWGLVAGVPAGLCGGAVADVVHLPTRLLVGWVAGVARLSARLPLGTLGAVEATAATGALLGLLRRGGRPHRWPAWVLAGPRPLRRCGAQRSPPAPSSGARAAGRARAPASSCSTASTRRGCWRGCGRAGSGR